MNAKLNPTPLERKLKLYRILFARWWRAEKTPLIMPSRFVNPVTVLRAQRKSIIDGKDKRTLHNRH